MSTNSKITHSISVIDTILMYIQFQSVVQIIFVLNCQLNNHLTVSVDVFCDTEELHKYNGNNLGQEVGAFTHLSTVEPGKTYDIPLFVAYHCKIYVSPSGLGQVFRTKFPTQIYFVRGKSAFLTKNAQDGESLLLIWKKDYLEKKLCQCHTRSWKLATSV